MLLLLCPTFSAASDVGTLRVTPEQALYASDSWVRAKQLQVGDTFTTPDGRVAVVTSVAPVVQEEAVPVYGLQTDGPGNYFAKYVLVGGGQMSARRSSGKRQSQTQSGSDGAGHSDGCCLGLGRGDKGLHSAPGDNVWRRAGPCATRLAVQLGRP